MRSTKNFGGLLLNSDNLQLSIKDFIWPCITTMWICRKRRDWNLAICFWQLSCLLVEMGKKVEGNTKFRYVERISMSPYLVVDTRLG